MAPKSHQDVFSFFFFFLKGSSTEINFFVALQKQMCPEMFLFLICFES